MRARLISCDDFAGRTRSVIVFADRGRVVMVVPAGEVAFLLRPQVDELMVALAYARDEGNADE